MNLKYGHIWPKSNVLGPGKRYIIWTQGCFRRCFRCASPELQPIDQGSTINIEVLAQQIINSYDIDGITISGGEPFLQAKELGTLLSKVLRVRPELNVILFTGYKFEDLSKGVGSALTINPERIRKVLLKGKIRNCSVPSGTCLWCYVEPGTLRWHDLFVTNLKYKLMDLKGVIIKDGKIL